MKSAEHTAWCIVSPQEVAVTVIWTSLLPPANQKLWNYPCYRLWQISGPRVLGAGEGRIRAWGWDYSQRPTQERLSHSHDPFAVPGGLDTPFSHSDLRLTLQELALLLWGSDQLLLDRGVPLGTRNLEGLVESSGVTEGTNCSLIKGIPHFVGVILINITSLEVWVIGHMP